MAIGMTVQTISSAVCPATCGGGSAGVDARRRKRRIAIVISPQTIAATAIAGTRKTFHRSLTTRPWSVTDVGKAAGDDEDDEARRGGRGAASIAGDRGSRVDLLEPAVARSPDDRPALRTQRAARPGTDLDRQPVGDQPDDERSDDQEDAKGRGERLRRRR